MAELIVFSSVSLIILLILIQNLSFRVIYERKLHFIIDYSLFSVHFGKSAKKRGFSAPNTAMLMKFKRLFDFTLKHTEIHIDTLRFNSNEEEPHKFSVRYRNLFSLFSALLSYLSRKAKLLSANTDSISVSTDKSPELDKRADVSFTLPLYIAIFSAFLFFLITKTSYKEKRGKKQNV